MQQVKDFETIEELNKQLKEPNPIVMSKKQHTQFKKLIKTEEGKVYYSPFSKTYQGIRIYTITDLVIIDMDKRDQTQMF